jgi:hypothetical protein
MVAAQWCWDTAFMAATFGWKAAIAVVVNSVGVSVLFRKELVALPLQTESNGAAPTVPLLLVAVHLTFLVGVVVFAHHPPIFMGLFLFFLGMR